LDSNETVNDAANDGGADRAPRGKRRSRVANHPRFKTAARTVRWIFGTIFLLALASSIYVGQIVGPRAKLDMAISVGLLMLCLLIVAPWSKAAALRIRLFVLSIGLAIGFMVLEIFARVSTPYPIAVQGGRINLPFHSKTEHRVEGVAGLDELVTVSFNSLGFRGPEPPENWDESLTILCIGGSTTECTYLSDGKTWPARLSQKLTADFDDLWLNNAGIDGHSTFGHLQLINQYVSTVRPNVVLFYVGINDVGRSDLNRFDEQSLRTKSRSGESLARQIHRRLIRYSDVLALADNLRRQRMAKSLGLTHQVDFGHQSLEHGGHTYLELSDERRRQLLQSHDDQCTSGYRARLVKLIEECDALGIQVVLITQPALYGSGVDDRQGINLETVKVGQVDGWTQWQLLQKYNAITSEVGAEHDVPVIRMDNQVPKSSRYYYDLLHYTNDGAELVASIIHRELTPILGEWYPAAVSQEK
jgi:hypothetical protein